MDLPKFDGRTPLRKETMNDLDERVVRSYKSAPDLFIEQYKMSGTIWTSPPNAAQSFGILPDFFFICDGPPGYGPVTITNWTDPSDVTNNTKPEIDPQHPERYGVGRLPVPSGWPIELTEPIKYPMPVFGPTQDINTTPVTDNVLLLFPSQDVTGGTFRLRYEDQETDDLPWNITALAFNNALVEILGTGNVEATSVIYEPISPELTTMSAWAIRLKGDHLDEDATDVLFITSNQLTTLDENVPGQLSLKVVPYGPLASQMYQKITPATDVYGGRFKIRVPAIGAYTDLLSISANAKEVEAALNAIPALTGHVRVRGSIQGILDSPAYVARNEVYSYSGTHWPWATSLNRAPLDSISIDSTSLVGGSIIWSVEEISTRIPIPAKAPGYEWSYANVPLDRCQFWSNPNGVFGPWPVPCYYGRLTIAGEPIAGTFNLTYGATTVTMPWAGRYTLTAIIKELYFLDGPLSQTSGMYETIPPVTDQTAERPVDYEFFGNLEFGGPVGGLGAVTSQQEGPPWTIFFDDEVRHIGVVPFTIDLGEVTFFNGTTVAPATLPWTVTLTYERADTSRPRTDPYHHGIVSVSIPTGFTNHASQSFIVWRDRTLTHVGSSPGRWVPTIFDTHLGLDGNEPTVTTLEFGPISPSFGDTTFSGTWQDLAMPPKRYVMCDSFGGYVEAPDMRLVQLHGFIPYRVTLSVFHPLDPFGHPEPQGIFTPNYEFYNGSIVEPRDVDVSFDGPYGTRGYVLINPTAFHNKIFNSANAFAGGFKPSYSLRELIFPPVSVAFHLVDFHVEYYLVGGTLPNYQQCSLVGSSLKIFPAWAIGYRAVASNALPFDYFVAINHTGKGFPDVNDSVMYFKETGNVWNGLIQAPPRLSTFHSMEKVPPHPPYTFDGSGNPLGTFGPGLYGCWLAQQGPITGEDSGILIALPILADDPWDESLRDLYCPNPGKFMSISGCISGRWQATVTTQQGDTHAMDGIYNLDEPAMLLTPRKGIILGFDRGQDNRDPIGGNAANTDPNPSPVVYGPWTSWQKVVPVTGLGMWMGIKLMPTWNDFHYNYNPAWIVLLYLFETADTDVSTTLGIVPPDLLETPDRWGFPIAISEPIWPTDANTFPVDMTFVLHLNGDLRFIGLDDLEQPTPEVPWFSGEVPSGVLHIRIQELSVGEDWDFWVGSESGCWGTTTPWILPERDKLDPFDLFPTKPPLPMVGQATMRPMTGVGCLPVKLRMTIQEDVIPGSGLPIIGTILDQQCSPVGPPSSAYANPTISGGGYLLPTTYSSSPTQYILYCYGFVGRDYYNSNGGLYPVNGAGQFIDGWLAGLSFAPPYVGQLRINSLGVSDVYAESFVLQVDSDYLGPTVTLRYNWWNYPWTLPPPFNTILAPLPDEQIFFGTLHITSPNPFQLNGYIDIIPTEGPSYGKGSRLTLTVTL